MENPPTPTPATYSRSVGDSSALPAPPKRTLFLVLATFLAGSLLVGWIGKTEREFVEGRVAAPTVMVSAPGNGQVLEQLVKNGERVSPDSRVLVMTDGDAVEFRKEIARLETELQRRKAQADIDLAWRMRTVEAEILANQLKATDIRYQDYRLQLEMHAWRPCGSDPSGAHIREIQPEEVFCSFTHDSGLLRPPATDGFPVPKSVSALAKVSEMQIQLCEDRLQELQKLKQTLPEKMLKAAGVEELEKQLAAAQQKLAAAEKNEGRRTIKANAHGNICWIHADPRSQVKPGTPVAKVIDNQYRFLRVTVPSEKLGRFECGQDVVVIFHGRSPRTGTVDCILPPADDDTENVVMIVKSKGKLWPNVPLGTAARVEVPPKDND